MKKENKKENKIDPSLDIPSEANREKHINFLEEEEKSAIVRKDRRDEFSQERRKQWEEGIKQGKEERLKNERDDERQVREQSQKDERENAGAVNPFENNRSAGSKEKLEEESEKEQQYKEALTERD